MSALVRGIARRLVAVAMQFLPPLKKLAAPSSVASNPQRAPEDAHRELALKIAPWSALQFSLLGETRFSSGVSGKVVYDTKTQQVNYVVESGVRPRKGRFLLVTYNLHGKGVLRSHVLIPSTLPSAFSGSQPAAGGDGRATSGQWGGFANVTSSTRVFRSSWRCLLTVNGGTGNGATAPRAMIAWTPEELQSGVDLSTEDVDFRQWTTDSMVGRRARRRGAFPEFRWVEGEGELYYLLHQQLIVQELPLEIE